MQTTELNLLKQSLRRFVEKEVAPYYEQWEREGNIPREFWNKLGEAGFICVDIPEEYGGSGTPYAFSTCINEVFSSMGYNSIDANITVHANIIAHYILKHGSEEQKAYYLPKMATGELVSAIAMTEPNAGSDLQGIRTTAHLDKDNTHYVINGSKTFITNGQHCDFVIVVAKTDFNVPAAKGITLFFVDPKTPGFNRGTNLDKIGLHGCDTSELFIEDVRVPKSSILGNLNQGFSVLMSELPRERITIALSAIASIEGALKWTIDYVNLRTAFGQPLSKLQHIRFRIAEMQTEARVLRSFVNECLDLIEKGKLDTATASMAKLACTEGAGRIIDGCLQLFGGYGYMREYPISRAWVDARVKRIYGGTSEIMKEIISRDIFGK